MKRISKMTGDWGLGTGDWGLAFLLSTHYSLLRNTARRIFSVD
ncbi:hypothetical protein [Nostoc sp.]